MIHNHDKHPDLCYHTCPSCKGRIPEAFVRGGTPLSYLHKRKNRPPCRLIIVPGVHSFPVNGQESMEDALARQITDEAA